MNLFKQFSDLVSQGLCQVRMHENGKWFKFKYKNKVFYDNLWGMSPLLVHARGIVLDRDGNIIQNPFVKIFNPHEQYVDKFDDEDDCVWAEKVNGFLGIATWTDGELLVTTTGTFDSDYVATAKKWVETLDLTVLQKNPHVTFLFEICDQDDPHIVHEDEGIYLIGMRNNDDKNALLCQEDFLDCFAAHLGAMRRAYATGKYAEFKEVLKSEHMRPIEGYVIYSRDYTRASKVKLPYYLTTKFLARGKKNQCIWTDPKLARRIIDEEYYGLIDWLERFTTLYRWQEMDSAKRIQLVEYFFANQKPHCDPRDVYTVHDS